LSAFPGQTAMLGGAVTKVPLFWRHIAKAECKEEFWDLWLKKAKVSALDTSQGPHFAHSVLALEAAMANLGVVASTPALAAADLAAGRLVAPFALQVPIASSYYVVSNEPASKRVIVSVFRDWLLDEATQHVAQKRGAKRRRQ